LVGSTKYLGPDHPETLVTMNNLGAAYHRAGRSKEALPLLDLTLAKRTKILGPEHPKTLNSMNSLAALYWTGRRLDQSVPLFEETLRLREKQLGADHRETIQTAINLAVNYRDANRLAEAVGVCDRWLPRACAVLKPGHPVWNHAAGTAADIYCRAGHHDRA